MKKQKLFGKLAAGLAMTSMIAVLAACGDDASTQKAVEAAQEIADVAEEAVQEVTDAAAEAEEEMMSAEEQIKAVQDTLTYMGGLKTADDAAQKIDLAIFRNTDGDTIYLYAENGAIKDYGMYTTEDAKTDDGQEYTKIAGSMGNYGYHFGEDAKAGILVDKDGKALKAVELTEEDARAFVAQTLGG